MKKKFPIWAKGVIMLAILAMSAAIVMIYKSDSGTQAPEVTAMPKYDVYKKDKNDVSSITISSENGVMTFKNSGEEWTVNDIPSAETDAEKIESLLTSVLTVISNNEIEKNPQDLSVYGLDNPAVTVEIENKDTTVDKFIVGDKSPLSGEYFYMQVGSDTVYSIYSAKVSQMLYDAKYYQEFSRFSVNLAELNEIIIQRKSGNNIHLRVKDDLSSVASAYNIWEMTEPYDGVFNAIDQFVDDKIITPMTKLNISKVAEQTEDYGLSDPEYILTVKSVKLDENGNKTDESTQTLRISRNFDSKRFVSMDGRGNIYEIDSSSVEFMDADAFLIISKLAALRDIASTERVNIKGAGDDFVMEIEQNDDGNEFSFKINGQDEDSDNAKKIYQAIIGISADGMYDNEPLGGPEITIEFKGYNGSSDMIIELIPIDDLSYAIRRDGSVMFTVKKSSVRDMLNEIQS